MADVARWVTACESGLRWPAGTFLRAYSTNRGAAAAAILDGDAVAVAVRAMLDGRPERLWEGTATELLDALRGHVPESTLRSRAWPSGPRALADRLRRLAPVLRAEGIELEHGRQPGGNRTRVITLRLAER
jgi:3-mercaptopyruvate sulfurtransferase SseA